MEKQTSARLIPHKTHEIVFFKATIKKIKPTDKIRTQISFPRYLLFRFPHLLKVVRKFLLGMRWKH